MSYNPSSTTKKSLVFFGANANDPKFNSDATLYFDNSKLYTNGIVLPNNSYIGSAGDNEAIQIDGSGNIIVKGNFTVQGTTTSLNTDVVNIEDNIVVLNSNYTGDCTSTGVDAGIEIERGTCTNVWFRWDEGVDKWKFYDGTNTYGLWSGLSYSGDSNSDILLEGETLDFDGASGITTTVDAANNRISFEVSAEVISDKTAINSATLDSGNDYLLVWDATDSALKKITPSNLVAAASSSYITVVDDDSDTDTINLGENLALLGGEGIVTNISASNTVSFALNLNEVTSKTISVANDSIVFIDSDDNTNGKENVADFVDLIAGSALDTDNDGVLDVKVDGSTIVVNGSNQLEVSSIPAEKVAVNFGSYSTTSTITATDDIILATGGVSGISLTLPVPTASKKITIKKIDSAAGVITILQNSTDTIDGASSKALYYQYESLTLVSNGTNWFII